MGLHSSFDTQRGIDYLMRLKKLGLSILLFSTALVTAGVTTQANASASSSDPSAVTSTADTTTSDATHGVIDGTSTVWAELPAGSVALLHSGQLPIYNDDGVQSDTVTISPDGATNNVSRIAINLDPDNTNNLFLQYQNNSSDPNKWVKISSNVFLFIGGSSDMLTDEGGLTPTNLVVNFTDQDGKSIQKSIVLPISSETDQRVSYMNDNIATVMKTLHNDLTQVTYNIDGYTPRATDPVTSDGDYTTTFHYVKKSTPVTPGGNTTDNTTSNTTSAADSSSTSSEPSSSEQPAAQPAPVKETAVYATKAIGLYKTPTFTKANRQHFYAKQSRTNRPQFVVTGYARSKNGLLRYRVRDVHHAQWQGYITANSAYVAHTYYQTNPKTVKVLSRHGINAYNRASLKGKAVKHYARGTSLKIKAVKSYHLTNRFMLPNGHYISANKTLVIEK